LDAVSTVLLLGAKSTSTTASACPDKIRKHLPVTQPKLQTDRLKVWDTFYDQEIGKLWKTQVFVVQTQLTNWTVGGMLLTISHFSAYGLFENR
jgi:hypothetical protein